MNATPGLYGQSLTLMERLKADTFAAHARLHGLAFFQALFACQLPLESYVGQLRALSVIHAALEAALAHCAQAQVASVWQADMRRLPLLTQDLHFFDPRAVADIREAVDASLLAVEALRPAALEQPLTLLGWLYVLEGSTRGATVLAPDYARAFLLAQDEGLSYLHGSGASAADEWAVFCARMNALYLNDTECAQVSDAACDLFARLEAVFRALYPFSETSKTRAITSINPEAGRHPVPEDPREIEAAVRAGDVCWKNFPYFGQHYGERGQRFARSDAVWLATLHRHAPAQILRQVRWLGRVLAGRGMPTLLLRDQLDVLVGELSAAVPERRADYEKLRAASADLLALRRRHLSDAQVGMIERAFDEAAGPQEAARLPRAAEMLASALADELEGMEPTANGIVPWLTDSARFPADWIAAVNRTLDLGRKLVVETAATARAGRLDPP